MIGKIIQFILSNVLKFLPSMFSPVKIVMLIILVMVTIGVNYKWFYKKEEPAPIIKEGGNFYACQPETPLVGCSIHKLKAKISWGK